MFEYEIPYYRIEPIKAVNLEVFYDTAYLISKSDNHIAMIKRLPMGIENFPELRSDNFYYVDKTRLIKNLLINMAKVNLFTRQRVLAKP